jgi:hypothetical protein
MIRTWIHVGTLLLYFWTHGSESMICRHISRDSSGFSRWSRKQTGNKKNLMELRDPTLGKEFVKGVLRTIAPAHRIAKYNVVEKTKRVKVEETQFDLALNLSV